MYFYKQYLCIALDGIHTRTARTLTALWHILLGYYTDGRWNGANSPIDPWQHGHEGGAERGDRMDHRPA